jgi:hypothetical protein
MPKTQTSCPRCRQPIIAEIQQLFDVNVNPEDKQKFLSGNINMIRCNSCGYAGPLSTPLVYHDPEKELLLTYFPPELGLPVNEQERMLGPMITQVMNKLPPEKRKAYLLRPQTMFTLQLMIEKVLEGDGITKAMIEDSQKRLNLLQRLITASPDVRKEIVRQEEKLVDEQFYGIISRLIEASLASGDQRSARQLAELQRDLLPLTDAGRQLKKESDESNAAVKSLQEASQNGLTREKLLDLIIDAPSETRLAVLVSMARSGMDYAFFQILAERINQAEGEVKEKLGELREKLLQMTQQIDQKVKEQVDESHQVLEKILHAPDIEAAMQENLDMIDTFFLEALKSEVDLSRQKGNLERLGKLQKITSLLEKMSAPPPEIALIEQLANAETEDELRKMLEENAQAITPELLDMINGLIGQYESQGQQPEVVQQLTQVYNAALRFSMELNLRK